MQNWKSIITACKEVLVGETGLPLSLGQMRAAQGKSALDADFELREVILSAKAAEWPPRRRLPVIALSVEKAKQSRDQKCGQKQSVMHLIIQVTASHESAQKAQEQIVEYTEALCDVLFRNEGLWAEGVHYAGGWAVAISPSVAGGLGYMQNAEIKFEILAY